ncbi:MAG TPA: hypothetical protein V6C86_08595 [Oculatellaceae cyanobacterium]
MIDFRRQPYLRPKLPHLTLTCALLAIYLVYPLAVPAQMADKETLLRTPAKADLGKGVIEAPTKRITSSQLSGIVKDGNSMHDVLSSPAGIAAGGNAKSESVVGSPSLRVAPGKVRWHATLSEAMVASKLSGKPVLLFQMMGKLDDAFC